MYDHKFSAGLRVYRQEEKSSWKKVVTFPPRAVKRSCTCVRPNVMETQAHAAMIVCICVHSLYMQHSKTSLVLN